MTLVPPSSSRPVLLVGCGRLGSALVEGWRTSSVLAAQDLMIQAPSPSPATDAAAAWGAPINPGPETVGQARTVVLAVKPAVWRAATAPLVPHLSADAVVVSVMAGVGGDALSEAFAGRPVVRVMPTTAVAQGQGVAAVWSADPRARAAARALFDPVADTVDLEDEALIDPATAVAGSAPAFILAFVQALADAGAAHGLPPAAAVRLARGALRSAASGAASGAALEALIARIASPGGTTEAGLKAMSESAATATAAAVGAATRRAMELGSRESGALELKADD